MPSELVVTCVAAASAVAPCGLIGGVPHAPAVVSRPMIEPSQFATLELWSGPSDMYESAEYFFFALSVVVSLWFFAYAVGSVVDAVRKL